MSRQKAAVTRTLPSSLQVKSRTYSLESNLALLRFYQISPQAGKSTFVAKALLLSIMHLPNPDFKACVHLLTERMQVINTWDLRRQIVVPALSRELMSDLNL